MTGPARGSTAPPLRARAPEAKPQTLGRAERVRKRAEFIRIQQSPARVATPHLLMLLSLRPGEGPARLGVVASRKVGPAVVRNRAKRLVRDAFRRQKDIFPGALDVVIVVRPGIHRLSQIEVDEQMRRARPQLARRTAELREGRLGPKSPPLERDRLA